MTAKITDEMRQALKDRSAIELVDDLTEKKYVLVSQDELERFLDERLLQELQIGFDQSDRGESQSWDIDATIAEANRRHAERKDQCVVPTVVGKQEF